MKEKWMSSIMAGVFISMGAMTYLAIPNTLVSSLFFAVGILLVLNLHNMLVTRVCPLLVYDGRYGWGDVAIAWAGNGIGTLAVAGHNNSIVAKCAYPSLTSVDNGVDVLSRTTAENVVALFSGRPVPRTFRADFSLIRRQSF